MDITILHKLFSCIWTELVYISLAITNSTHKANFKILEEMMGTDNLEFNCELKLCLLKWGWWADFAHFNSKYITLV